ncbi:hypothetical protein Dtox_3921 [Desulfofarcimen acetoxidans DSM 771]|uniref:DUF4435 domain-containing protein n=1 Tax=Desulfofarcimen acetoxidans (strain ATCC 49208 / DSM 771 / KCTC 5769 / VKM B-1644 / 5575) TaxID=485916 RepID=C8VXY5_DESAS|nr:hypothetical protein [Desulfofarcimen acetoxidans]ACV64614.1 hypothetical protein Dtox_3921 [Desulfofarcimen acetoxidans DSM 771]
MSASMKFDLDEVITGAIMSKTPAIIVEGQDDIKFYEMIAYYEKKDVEVYAVENFEEYTEGCNEVIECLRRLQDKIEEKEDNIKYIMGIIDRDARYFRKEIPDDILGLFVLKYYSYESHFATEQSLIYLISQITESSVKKIDEDCINYVQKNLENDYKDLYYISLEALKKACVPEYEAILGYKVKSGRIADTNSKRYFLSHIGKKKKELDIYAEELNLGIKDLPIIAKGKWLLKTFANSVFMQIKNLSEACEQGTIKKCQYCLCGQNDKCLWRLNANYTINHIYHKLLNNFEEEELNYIKEKLNSLA